MILVARRHHAFRDCVSSAACVGHHQNKNAREGALVASFFECRRSLRVAPLAREVPTSITILNAPRRRISNGRLRHVLHGARRPTRRKKRRCNIAPASHVSAQPAWIALVADACWSRGGLSPIDEAGDVAERMRIGRLFLAAGSPGRAADVFRGVLKDQPENTDAYAGLGDADFTRGDYRAAQGDFQSVLRLNPTDQGAAERLDLCNRVLALDPAVRGIGAAERFRRSRVLVQMTLDAAACLGLNSPQELIDEGHQAIKQRVGAADYAATEANLDLSGKLWTARLSGCGHAPDPEDPVGLVLGKVSGR